MALPQGVLDTGGQWPLGNFAWLGDKFRNNDFRGPLQHILSTTALAGQKILRGTSAA